MGYLSTEHNLLIIIILEILVGKLCSQVDLTSFLVGTMRHSSSVPPKSSFSCKFVRKLNEFLEKCLISYLEFDS